MRHALASVLFVMVAVSVTAQQRPLFDADDFVDPRQRHHPILVFRVITGGAWSLIDDYRPLDQNVAFAQFAGGVYWSHFQFDYKRSEVRGEDDRNTVQMCGQCSPPIFFPTPPPPDAIPAPPPPGSRDSLQFGWYHRIGHEVGGLPAMLRYRLTISRQPIETIITSVATGKEIARQSGREQSFGLDGDTYFRIGKYDHFGSFAYARTKRSGTTDDRSQHELTYTSRFPGFAHREILFRTMLTVGGVSDRGGTAINLVNPYFEAFWREQHTSVNIHLVWSPQMMNSGAGGWETQHQVVVFLERAFVFTLK